MMCMLDLIPQIYSIMFTYDLSHMFFFPFPRTDTDSFMSI